MPFESKNLHDPTPGPRRTGTNKLFTYRSTDTIATVVDDGYFDGRWRQMESGDLIHVIQVNGSDVIQAASLALVLTSTRAGGVTVSDGTTINVTNTE